MNDLVDLIQVFTEDKDGEAVEFGTGKSYTLKTVIVNGNIVKTFDGVRITKQKISPEQANGLITQTENG